MNDIKCPHCGKVFKVDQAGFADILKQVRDHQFEKELNERLISRKLILLDFSLLFTNKKVGIEKIASQMAIKMLIILICSPDDLSNKSPVKGLRGFSG